MKLIILNGPTGVGKTTLAKKLQEASPHSYFIHFDELRRNIGRYAEYRNESRQFTFDLCFAIMKTCFEQGRDVLMTKSCLISLKKDKQKTA